MQDTSTFDAPPPRDAPPRGWHDDPTDPHQLRYWDGTRWTDVTLPHPDRPAPAARSQRRRPPATVWVMAALGAMVGTGLSWWFVARDDADASTPVAVEGSADASPAGVQTDEPQSSPAPSAPRDASGRLTVAGGAATFAPPTTWMPIDEETLGAAGADPLPRLGPGVEMYIYAVDDLSAVIVIDADVPPTEEAMRASLGGGVDSLNGVAEMDGSEPIVTYDEDGTPTLTWTATGTDDVGDLMDITLIAVGRGDRIVEFLAYSYDGSSESLGATALASLHDASTTL